MLTLRLVAEIMPALVLFKLQILHVLLNCVQLYAPPAHPVRPRVIKRLNEKELAKLEREVTYIYAYIRTCLYKCVHKGMNTHIPTAVCQEGEGSFNSRRDSSTDRARTYTYIGGRGKDSRRA